MNSNFLNLDVDILKRKCKYTLCYRNIFHRFGRDIQKVFTCLTKHFKNLLNHFKWTFHWPEYIDHSTKLRNWQKKIHVLYRRLCFTSCHCILFSVLVSKSNCYMIRVKTFADRKCNSHLSRYIYIIVRQYLSKS